MEPRGERGRQGAAPLGGHTPGPWVVVGYSDGLRVESRNEELPTWQRDIADVNPQGAGANATARLIAAAPELLEALEGCFYNRPGWQDKARSAIAKARGEQ